MDEKYRHFGLVGLDGRYQSELSQETGKENINKLKMVKEKVKQRAIRAKASWESAHASETALKSFLVYTDLIKMPCFTHTRDERALSGTDRRGNPMYSYYPKMDGENLGGVWRLLLDGRRKSLSVSDQSRYTDPKFGIIGNPQALLTEIQQYAMPGDFRKDADYMRIDSVHPYRERDRISGHDLFAYLKLQSPEIQTLINNDFFLSGDKISKEEKVIGILEGFGNDSNQSYTNQESIFENARAFETRRFDWITGEEIADEDLKVIEDFADINNEILKFKFPDEDLLRWIYKQDYSQFDSTVFSLLDPILKYYVKEMFSQEEINVIDGIAKTNHLNPSDSIVYANMCVYYKYYIREMIKDQSSILDFDKSNHAENILKHSDNMKQYDASGEEKLEDNTHFISHLSSIKEIQEKIDNYNDEEAKLRRIKTSPDGRNYFSLTQEEIDAIFRIYSNLDEAKDVLDMIKYIKKIDEKRIFFHDHGHDDEVKSIEEEIDRISNLVREKMKNSEIEKTIKIVGNLKEKKINLLSASSFGNWFKKENKDQSEVEIPRLKMHSSDKSDLDDMLTSENDDLEESIVKK